MDRDESSGESAPRVATKKPPVWPGVVAACVLVLGAAVLWVAKTEAEDRYEREALSKNIAHINGHQTCKMAWHKAGLDMGTSVALDGRFPDIYAPEMRVPGPPKVVACPMVKAGQSVEPMLVLVRCDRFDLDCVEPQF